MRVEDGPALNGYMGVSLSVHRESRLLPNGAAGYLALVETLRPGEEGSPIERRVLRVLAGPLPIDAALPRVEHLLALRLPQGARGERLGAVAGSRTAADGCSRWRRQARRDAQRRSSAQSCSYNTDFCTPMRGRP